MKIAYSERFLRSLREAPPEVQNAFLKQSALLVENIRHPSLRAKKYDQSLGLWQARVNRHGVFISQLKAIPTECKESDRTLNNRVIRFKMISEDAQGESFNFGERAIAC